MIYQILPSIAKFDAISQHALRIDKELKKRNIETQLVAEHIGAEFLDLVKKPIEIDSFDNSQILYHLMDPLLNQFQQQLEREFGWTVEKQISWVREYLIQMLMLIFGITI